MSREMGLEPKAFKRFVSTRFRTLRLCIEPVLYNFVPLVWYYKLLKKPTDKQKHLQVH